MNLFTKRNALAVHLVYMNQLTAKIEKNLLKIFRTSVMNHFVKSGIKGCL
jgi:hypothetical protein